MRLRLLGLVLTLSIASALFSGCGNSIDAAPNPTPTPGESPTPTPGGYTGTYSVSAAAPIQQCTGNDVNNDGSNDVVQLTFNAPSVYIAVDGGDFTPDWGFNESGTLSVPDPEHGTISGANWTAYYTYCDYSGIAGTTTKHVVTWTGMFNGGGTFDSTLTQKLRNTTAGNETANCGATETAGNVTDDMLQCTNPGISWSIHGVLN